MAIPTNTLDRISTEFRGDAFGGPRGDVAATLQKWSKRLKKLSVPYPHDGVDAVLVIVQADEYKGHVIAEMMADLASHKPDELMVYREGEFTFIRLWWD